MKNYVKATVIVTAAVAVNLRKLSQMLDKGDLDGLFATELSATGLAPATHYISSGHVPAAYLNAITSNTRLFTIAKAAWEADGLVFPFTQLQVTNALSKCTVSSTEDPFVMMEALGLKLVQAPV